MKKGTTIIILVIIVIFLFLLGYFQYKNWKAEISKIPPVVPSKLIASQTTATQVKLTWKDNSNNEIGFILYRDGETLAELSENKKTYLDTGLKPATRYYYQIKAYNLSGESDVISYSIMTSNPPIRIWIEKIGVGENGEEGELLREYDLLGRPAKGEECISLLVQDEKTSVQKVFHYSLHKDEVKGVDLLVFDTKEVGDHLRLFVTSFEDDGGNTEQLVYQAMGKIAATGFDLPISVLLKIAGVDISSIFADIFADLFASGDDFMGSYGQDWNISNDWGVGEYGEIECLRENGHVGLRLWFRVECPAYDYSLGK
jgi:hypothetical protein